MRKLRLLSLRDLPRGTGLWQGEPGPRFRSASLLYILTVFLYVMTFCYLKPSARILTTFWETKYHCATMVWWPMVDLFSLSLKGHVWCSGQSIHLDSMQAWSPAYIKQSLQLGTSVCPSCRIPDRVFVRVRWYTVFVAFDEIFSAIYWP